MLKKRMAAFLVAGLMTVMVTTSVYAMDTTATITFTDGDLTLDLAPSFNFGAQKLTEAAATYNSVDSTNKLQVSNMRTQMDDGWRVTAQLSGFKDAADADSLTGAVITLTGGDIGPLSAGNTSTMPTTPATITLTAGSSTEQEVLKAEDTEGKGSWVVDWGGSKASITVQPGMTLGVHQATITWTLYNTP